MRALKAAFALAGMVSFALACRAGVARLDGSMLPGAAEAGAAAVALAAGLLLAAAAWVTLLRGEAEPAALVRGFVMSQLGKYIPGGVWLGAGQVGLAVAAGASMARAVGALAVLGIAVAVAAAVAGAVLAPVVFGASAETLAAAALGATMLLLLDRRWMRALAVRAGKRLSRRTATDRLEVVVPPQPAILRAFALVSGTVICSAIAFVVLLHGIAPGIDAVPAAAAFCVAWLAGYLVPGLPSGIGAREAVLVGLLPGNAAPIVAASLAQRVVLMLVEATLLGLTHVRLSSASLRRLPNALSALRLALVPVLWLFALRDAAGAVAAGLVLAGVTDFLDGRLARRLGVASPFGAKLDSLADNALAVSAPVWVALLRPDVIDAYRLPLSFVLTLYGAFLGVAWVRFRRVGNLHLSSARLGTVLLYAFAVHATLWRESAPLLFWPAFAVVTAGLVEGLALMALVRRVDEHAASLVVVWQRAHRRSRMRARVRLAAPPGVPGRVA